MGSWFLKLLSKDIETNKQTNKAKISHHTVMKNNLKNIKEMKALRNISTMEHEKWIDGKGLSLIAHVMLIQVMSNPLTGFRVVLFATTVKQIVLKNNAT